MIWFSSCSISSSPSLSFLAFVLLFATQFTRLVHSATCNICGCQNCIIGFPQGTFSYPNPNGGDRLRNNCQTAQAQAASGTSFTQAQCDELYKWATQVCNCVDVVRDIDIPKYCLPGADECDDQGFWLDPENWTPPQVNGGSTGDDDDDDDDNNDNNVGGDNGDNIGNGSGIILSPGDDKGGSGARVSSFAALSGVLAMVTVLAMSLSA